MDLPTALRAIRDNLRTNLTDPRITAGETYSGRTWIISSDDPRVDAKYPRVQVKKNENTNEILDIGTSFTDHEMMFSNIYFYTKKGFKIVVGSNTYKDEELVEYYLSLIKSTLKSNQATTITSGINGFKAVTTSEVGYDPDTQIFYGFAVIRYWWFNS